MVSVFQTNREYFLYNYYYNYKKNNNLDKRIHSNLCHGYKNKF